MAFSDPISCSPTPRSVAYDEPARQDGVVLVIALIVLVAMSLAAVALTRSVSIGNIAAGNLSFKQGALSTTDRGVAVAFKKFVATSAGGTAELLGNTDSNSSANAYCASIQPVDGRGVPNQLNAPFTANATNCPSVVPASFTVTATGETVRYLIDRQCTRVSSPSDPADATYCTTATAPIVGGTLGRSGPGGGTVPVFRVTVRVDGPRNTTSFSQVVFRP